jgi:DNA-binding transcriptional LysR family regulator
MMGTVTNMELYQLRGFAAVAEQGHLTRAAEKLHVSQPALSAQIKALEDELSVALFVRTSGGMALTPAGKRLLADAERVISAAQAMRASAKSLQGEVAGHARVGTLLDPEFIRLGELLSMTVERYPLLETELHHEISGVAFQKVLDGELDASFYYGDRSHPSIASTPLREVAFRVAAPAAWLPLVESATWETIAEQPWILAPQVSTHHALAEHMFATHGITPATRIEADHEAVIHSLVARGLGMALMREDLAKEASAQGLVCLWGGVRLTTQLQFIHPRDRHNDAVIEALRAVIESIWAPPPVARQIAPQRTRTPTEKAA